MVTKTMEKPAGTEEVVTEENADESQDQTGQEDPNAELEPTGEQDQDAGGEDQDTGETGVEDEETTEPDERDQKLAELQEQVKALQKPVPAAAPEVKPWTDEEWMNFVTCMRKLEVFPPSCMALAFFIVEVRMCSPSLLSVAQKTNTW